MKDFISITDLTIWIVLIVGRVVLCLAILRRNLFSRMPLFSLYAIGSTAESILLLAVAFLFSYKIYYYVFYLTSHFVSLLAFLTLIEGGRRVLPGLDLPQKEKALSFLAVAVVGIAIFVGFWPLHFVENRIELGSELVIGVAFIFVAVYSRYLGLYWSRLVAGISFTLGLLYLVQTATKAMAWHYPLALTIQVRQLSQIANILAVIAWIVVVLSPWGERVMTEQDLEKIEAAFSRIEASLGADRVHTL